MCFNSHLAQHLGIATRRAVVGDELITKEFARGLISFENTGNPGVLVCIAPGTKLRIDLPEEIQHRWGAKRTECVEFIDGAGADRIRLEQGTSLVLASLGAEVRATVLAIPKGEASVSSAAA